jgi:hypothetical protein
VLQLAGTGPDENREKNCRSTVQSFNSPPKLVMMMMIMMPDDTCDL